MAAGFVIGLSSDAYAKYNPRYASIVIDARTGVVISERYPDKILHPASLTKVMTLFLTFDAIKARQLSLHSRILISRHAANMVPSKLGLKKGETIRVKDAIQALTTKSANDVAVALAEAIGGTESNFALMMTQKAGELGMSRTTFRNASGLHDKRQVSTARDMAKLARAIMVHHPEFYSYFSQRSFSYKGKTYRNHNRLLGRYKGMDGMKTGYVRASGFNLMASAVRGKRRLIGIVYGGRSTYSRNRHMSLLLDKGFSQATDLHVAALAEQARAIPKPRPTAGYQIAKLDTNIDTEEFDERFYSLIVGEGDIDPEATRQLANTLAAMTKSRTQDDVVVTSRIPGRKPPVARKGDWAIQVGAFMNRTDTSRAIRTVQQKLPHILYDAKPQIVPMRAGKKTVYRARLAGIDRQSASEACNLLDDCLRLAPKSR